MRTHLSRYDGHLEHRGLANLRDSQQRFIIRKDKTWSSLTPGQEGAPHPVTSPPPNPSRKDMKRRSDGGNRERDRKEERRKWCGERRKNEKREEVRVERVMCLLASGSNYGIHSPTERKHFVVYKWHSWQSPTTRRRKPNNVRSSIFLKGDKTGLCGGEILCFRFLLSVACMRACMRAWAFVLRQTMHVYTVFLGAIEVRYKFSL